MFADPVTRLALSLLLVGSTGLLTRTDLGAQVGPPRPNPRVWSSGGPILAEQASYDVRYYDIGLRVSPADSTIRGSVAIVADIIRPISWFVVDLDTAFVVTTIRDGRNLPLRFRRRGGRLWIEKTAAQGDRQTVRIDYRGRPRIAPRPPWLGGFQWARTASGAPWVATTTVNDGADLYWPVKDHPSDKPDSVGLHLTVPTGLVAASNGRFRGSRVNGDGTTTWDWFVSTPISNYNVALNIAPYRTVTRSFRSVSGDTIPVTYWVLPENLARGERLADEMLRHLRWYEERLGPYPFRADKYGVAETPHLGMEHQTIIAYGNGYKTNEFGYDELHQHELAHEWFGNLVTASDWSDYWLHEGFASYMQPWYTETLKGAEAYRTVIRRQWAGSVNRRPVAEPGPLTAGEVYFNPPDYRSGDGDIYGKGSVVLHSLRFLMGDSLFAVTLRRWLYPTPAMEQVTNGRQVRFVTTDEFVGHASRIMGRDLGWFFRVYVRQARLPRLRETRTDSTLALEWEVEGNLSFPMPVEIEIDGRRSVVEMPNGRAEIPVGAGKLVLVDPHDWVFRSK